MIRLAADWRSNSGSTVARSWRVSPVRHPKSRPPLDDSGLQRLALRYVERYATTRARLVAYLDRKLGERGWAGEGVPDPAAIAARFAELGYIDDAGFAAARASALGRRGYGLRRIGDALRAAGIAADDARDPLAGAVENARAAALAFARRKRIGPYADRRADPDLRARQLAAMARAGHDFAVARFIVDLPPGEFPPED